MANLDSPGEVQTGLTTIYRELANNTASQDIAEAIWDSNINLFDTPRLELLSLVEIQSLPTETYDPKKLRSHIRRRFPARGNYNDDITFEEVDIDPDSGGEVALIGEPSKILRGQRGRIIDTIYADTGLDELPSVFRSFQWRMVFGVVPVGMELNPVDIGQKVEKILPIVASLRHVILES